MPSTTFTPRKEINTYVTLFYFTVLVTFLIIFYVILMPFVICLDGYSFLFLVNANFFSLTWWDRFIYDFMGLGILVLCISFLGCIAAEMINGCCLCFVSHSNLECLFSYSTMEAQGFKLFCRICWYCGKLLTNTADVVTLWS